MADDPLLELDARRRIVEFVRRRPGSYLRELQRGLGMPMGALEYHLGRLQDAGLLTALQGENKRYFPTRMDAAEKRYLVLLRQEACRRVVLRLLAAPGSSHQDLAAATGYRPSTLSYYLAKLVESGLATRTHDGRQNRYALADGGRAYAILVRHAPSFLDRVLDRFLEGFEGLRVGREEEEGAAGAAAGPSVTRRGAD